MEIKYIKKRYVSLVVFIVVIFVLFISRLVNWQIINASYYKLKSLQSHSYVLKTEPVRGEILDRFGNGLAVNSIGYRLVLDDFNLTRGQESNCIHKILDLINYLKIDWNDNLPIILVNNEFMFDEDNQEGIKHLKKEISVSNPDDPMSYINFFKKKLNCGNMSNKTLRDICSIYYSTRVNPVVSDNIDERSMNILSEFNVPGFRIEATTKRYYPYGDLAAHILGFTGLMSSEEYEKYKDDGYKLNSTIGKSGIEKLYENKLRGSGGSKAFHFSKEGVVTNSEIVVQSQPGNSIVLTIDANLQKAAQDALETNVKSAASKGTGSTSGAAVAIDVKTGEILAAASYPGFDLSKYHEDKSYRKDLYNDSKLPLLNRSINGAYPPGSTFKTLIAAAALQEGLLNKLDETINCSGSFNYYTGYRLRCTGVHGNANLLRALARSCNVFFAELGRRLGLSNIDKYAKEFGVNGKTGIELNESPGTLGSLEKNSNYKSDSSQSAIGQGGVAITPLQLAKIIAGIASGNNFKTHIVKKIVNYTNTEDIEVFPSEFEKINISEENLDLVRKAMREVVLTGLATDFRSYPVEVAAKTGTAQTTGTDHTTFVCYAPYSDPQIAISVIIANGKYGGLSKAVARSIMNAYFKV